jgi:transposase-like protein
MGVTIASTGAGIGTQVVSEQKKEQVKEMNHKMAYQYKAVSKQLGIMNQQTNRIAYLNGKLYSFQKGTLVAPQTKSQETLGVQTTAKSVSGIPVAKTPPVAPITNVQTLNPVTTRPSGANQESKASEVTIKPTSNPSTSSGNAQNKTKNGIVGSSAPASKTAAVSGSKNGTGSSGTGIKQADSKSAPKPSTQKPTSSKNK